MKVSNNDVRLLPTGKLTKKLMETELIDEKDETKEHDENDNRITKRVMNTHEKQ